MLQFFKNFFGEYWFIIILSIPIALYYSYFIFRYLLRLPYKEVGASSFSEKASLTIPILSSRQFFLRFTRKVLVFLLLVYSASFLTVVLPSDPADPIAHLIYFLCALFYIFYFFHVVAFLLFYKRTAGFTYYLNSAGVSWMKNGEQKELNLASQIQVWESFQILFLSDGKTRAAIPLFLIADRHTRAALVEYFSPASPNIAEKGRQGLEIFESVIIALILAMHIRQFAVQAFYIPSGSMEMTLQIGDHLLVDKISLGPYFPPVFGMKKPLHLKFLSFSSIKRGDIIVFKPPIPNEHREFIKRVIGLPGESVEFKQGKVFINNRELAEPYLNKHDAGWVQYYAYLSKTNPAMVHEPSCPRINHTEYLSGFTGKVTIPAGHYLMMGDHRDNSSDSRSWGFVPRENIRGKAWILYFNYYNFLHQMNFSRLGWIQ